MEDCTIQGTSPPTLEDIEKKLKDIKEAVNYEFKEADIDQVRECKWSIYLLDLFNLTFKIP